MASDQEKFVQARDLIKQKEYDRARALLRTIDSPKATEWLQKLNELDPPKPARRTPSTPPPPAKAKLPCGVALIILLIGLALGGAGGFLVATSLQSDDDEASAVVDAATNVPTPTSISFGVQVNTPDPNATPLPTATVPPVTLTPEATATATLPPPSATPAPSTPAAITQPWHSSTVQRLLIAPDGTRLLSADSAGHILQWELPSGTVVSEIWVPLTPNSYAPSVINSLSISPDQRYLAVGDQRSAFLYDLSSGGLLHTWASSTELVVDGQTDEMGEVHHLTFLSDGRLLIRTLQGYVFTLNPTDPTTLTHLTSLGLFNLGGGDFGGGLEMTEALDQVVIGRTSTGNVAIYDTASSAIVQELAGHKGFITDVIFFSDGRRLVTASMDTTVRVWDKQIGVQTLLMGTESGMTRTGIGVWDIALSPDEQVIASAYSDTSGLSRVDFWDANTGTLLRSVNLPYRALTLAFAADGRQVIVGGGGGDGFIEGQGLIESIDVASAAITGYYGVEVIRPSVSLGTAGRVAGVAISGDSAQIYTTHGDNEEACMTRVWERASASLVTSWSLPNSCLGDLVLSPNNALVAAFDGTSAYLLDSRTGQINTTLAVPPNADGLAYAPDGQTLLVTYLWWGGEVKAFAVDANTGQPSLSFVQPTAGVGSAAYSRDGSRLVLTWGPEEVLIYDATTRQPLKLIKAGYAPWAAALSSDGQLLVTGGPDGADVWDTTTGERRVHFSSDRDIRRVTFAPSDRYVVIQSSGSIRIVDAQTGVLRAVLFGGDDDFALAPDGRYIVTDGLDYAINYAPIAPMVWDTPLLVAPTN